MSLFKKLFSFGFVCWFALAQTLFGTPVVFAQSNTIDVEPPLIEHDIVTEVEADIRQSFFATVVDDDELDSVSLYYRFENDSTYGVRLMNRVSYSSTYIAHIPTDPESNRNIEYYIQARDKAGNRTVRGYAFNPLVRVIESASVDVAPVIVPAETASKSGLSSKQKTGIYVVLGVLAAGLLAGAVGGSDSSTNPPPENNCCTVSVTVGQP